MSDKTVLVVGCTGVNGYAVTRHFEELDGWQVKTLSRSQPDYGFDAEHIAADLLDDLEPVTSQLKEVTHVVYAALKPSDDPAQEADENAQMMKNLVNTLDRVAKLQHVTFLQGGKVYGAHLGIYKTPAEEDDSRHFPPNLYFGQEDFLKEASQSRDWRYTALRPDIVIGHSLGSAMNLGNLLGSYASLCKEQGLALHYPGSPVAFEILVNVTDAELVARAAEWSFAEPEARDQAFNITNGDVFRWKHVWPRIADYFELDVAEPQPFPMQTHLNAHEALWSEMVEKYDLEKTTLEELGQGSFGDFIFKVENDAIFNVNKARRAGFQGMTRDSAESLLKHFEKMRGRRLIP